MTFLTQRLADFYMFTESEGERAPGAGDTVFRGFCTQVLLRWPTEVVFSLDISDN